MQVGNMEERYELLYRYSSSFLKFETEKILDFLRWEEFRAVNYSKMIPSFIIDTITDSKAEIVLDFL